MSYAMIMRALYSFAVAVSIVLFTVPGSACAQPLGPGDLFPDFSHANNLDTPECDYLGIDPASDFHLGSLKQDIVILEFMNVFCDMCREDVDLYNELFEISRGDSELAGTFAVLGVAVGNSFEEVMQCSDELFVNYPILLDTDREILSLTGSVRGAPQTYILQRQGDRYVIRHFSRSATGKDEYLAIVQAQLDRKPEQAATPAQAFSYSLITDGTTCTEKQFTGSRVLLYFPHKKSYPHASDTRNTAQQIEVLQRVLEQYPDIRIILVEPEGNGRTARKGIELPPSITRATGDPALFDQLASNDHPTVYYIDKTGSAVFKGQALTMSALRSMIDGRYRAEPDMAEADIISLITRTLASQDASVIDTVKTDIAGHAVYRTGTKDPARFYFSLLESSPSLCDLCHDSHFIYSIDPKGTIVSFIPVWLPKRGNVSWSAEEIDRYRTIFKGNNIHDTFQFNAAHDAVSGATITSSIVYEGFNRGKEIFKQLQPDTQPPQKNGTDISSTVK